MAVVLIIEDDAEVAGTLQSCIQAAGYTSYLAETGEQGLALCQQLEPDIIILDLMLPGMDGLEVCTQVRQLTLRRVPYILMLMAKRGQAPKIQGNTIGADDYMAKPLSPDRLIARLRALPRELRHGNPTVATDEALIRYRCLRLHQTQRHCSVRAASAEAWIDLVLTDLEFDLLAKLARQPGRVYLKSQLLEDIWGLDHPGDDHKTVDDCVMRLRRALRSKLRVSHKVNPLVKTVEEVGYKFEDAIY